MPSLAYCFLPRHRPPLLPEIFMVASWIRRRAATRSKLARRRAAPPRLGVEMLEQRRVLATVSAAFTADNHYGLYVGNEDGSQLTLVGRNESGPAGSQGAYNWSYPEFFEFDAPAGSHLFLVAWDSGLWQMAAGQFTVDGGQTIGTNAQAWEVMTSSHANPGDTGPLPDLGTLAAEIQAGSFQAPQAVAPPGTSPWGRIPGLSDSAQFIWPDTFAHTSASDSTYVIFRTTEPIDGPQDPPASAGATLTADNHYGLFVGSGDGERLAFIGRNEVGLAGNPGKYNWSLPETWNFTPQVDDHIYVVAWDVGGPQSWIGQFTLPDGSTLVSNSQDWEYVIGAGPNPGTLGAVPPAQELRTRIAAAGWQAIGAQAANDADPWGAIPGISPTANFVWHDKFADGSASDAGYAIYRTKNPMVSVDLDVDSDNSGEVDRSDAEDRIEAATNRPGVIVAVGGARAKMVVEVSGGQTARLELAEDATEKVVLWHEATGGQRVFQEGASGIDLTAPVGTSSTTWTFWIEAIARSASIADITFTLVPIDATGGSTAQETVKATAVGVDLVAHRTGGRFGEVVSESLEDSGDPNAYMILTNRDFEQGLPLAGRDFDDAFAFVPPLVGLDGEFDDDLARITLKQLPSGLAVGSVSLVVSHPQAVRLFKNDGTALLPTEWSSVLSSPDYLSGLSSGDVEIWLEGLSTVPDFQFAVHYEAPSGRTATDDVHMLIAEWTFQGSDGSEVPFVSPIWLDALLAATDAPKTPLNDTTGAFYKIQIDGLAPHLVTELTVASDSTSDSYTESYAGGDFDTSFTNKAVTRRFGVLYSAADVLYAPEDPVVSEQQRELIRETLDLNVVHNDGLEGTVETPFDRHVAKLRAAPLFTVTVDDDVVAVGGRIRGTITWQRRFPDDRPFHVHTDDGQQSPALDLMLAPGAATFDFAANAEGTVAISAGWPSGLPGGFLDFHRGILVRVTTDGTLPKWEQEAWDSLKVGGFVPGDPINRNRQINSRYAEMYNSGIGHDGPNPYGWFGVAAFVSTGVGVGMSMAMLLDAAPDNLGVDSRKVIRGLADGNLTIFLDVYKQALAYQSPKGVGELADMLERGELRDPRQLNAWTIIKDGVDHEDQERADAGVRLLVQVEQDTTLQEVLNKDLPLWQSVTDNWGTWLEQVASPLGRWELFLMTSPIPGEYSTFQEFRYEDPLIPDNASFGNVDARLAWFDAKLFPA